MGHVATPYLLEDHYMTNPGLKLTQQIKCIFNLPILLKKVCLQPKSKHGLKVKFGTCEVDKAFQFVWHVCYRSLKRYRLLN